MFDELLSTIAPHVCLTCGEEGTLWCGTCRRAMLPAVERCYKCNRLAMGGKTCRSCRRSSTLYSAQALTRYEDTAKLLVWRLKFAGARTAAQLIADMMAASLPLPPDAVLVHVPTSNHRVRQRGYDQACLIACRLAQQTGLRYHRLLIRLGNTQQHGASRAQRLSQLVQRL
jgi:predicted amidophosphoribosyltransferase